MSRIGRLPVVIPSGVEVKLQGNQLMVGGPKGQVTQVVPSNIKVEVSQGQVNVSRTNESKPAKANHGTIRSHIFNMIKGVTQGYSKQMEIRGTGYKFSVSENKLTVLAGFIHPVIITAPNDVSFKLDEDTKVTILGPNIVTVGQVASNIRKVRKPEPYKGKGIRYVNEIIKLKAGKKAKA